MKAIQLLTVIKNKDAKSMVSWLASAFVFLVLVFNAVPVGAQQLTEDNSAHGPNSDAISGRVVGVNGQAIPNAVVMVRALDTQSQGKVTTSDSDGNFRVSGLEAKVYLVSATGPAYTTPPRDPNNTQASFYRVGDSVRIELLKGGVITGNVTTPTGEPIVAVQVQAYMLRDINGKRPRYGSQSRQKLTDDRGIYRIYGLAPGTYVVAAGGTGTPFSTQSSRAYETDVQTYAPSATRSTAREIIVRAGEETTNVDIRYRGDPGFTLSGKARDSRSPTESYWFDVTLSSINRGDAQEDLSSYQSYGGEGFAIYGVADGDYMLTGRSYFGDEWAVSESQRIRVRGADVTGIELVTKPLASIAGRIVLEPSKVAECKNKRRPLFGETVITPWHDQKESKNQPLFLWALGGPTTPDKEGAFTLRNLAPGQYRLHTRFFARYWYIRSITLPSLTTSASKAPVSDRLQDVAKNWIALKLGDRLSGLVLTIAEGAASLHGNVKYSETQKPVSGLAVFLVPAETDKAEDTLRFFATRVATDGTFALNNVAPGRYWVSAKSAGEHEVDLQSKLRFPDQAAERAKLRQELAADKIEIELAPCQNVTNYSVPSSVR
ncbi:MAG TPA: carboxypeptidase-like regulatory domain-containing protein [Pyrinomonadaceae bacterium]|nr:carboxypeptidase-like regulatory domain-containing protein [Pyrinomonadaceae bacterium]